MKLVLLTLGIALGAMLSVGGAGAEPDSFRLVFDGHHAPASFPTPSGLQHEGPFTTSSSLCPSGTAKDVASLGSDFAARVFTCRGTGATFTTHVGPLLAEHGSSGTWQIVSGTGSLANFRGIGTWQSVLGGGDASDPSTVMFESTWKGVAAMDVTPPKVALARASISKLKRPAGAYRIALRLSISDDGGAATSYTLSLADARNPADRLAQRSGQSTTSPVSLTIRVKPATKTRFLRLKIDATDAVGNGAPFVKVIRIR